LKRGLFALVTGQRVDKLEDEVREGTSTLVASVDGEVERIVSLVVVRVERGDGTLARLGKWQNQRVAVNCTLPGTKLHGGEVTESGTDRVLTGELSPYILGGFRITGNNRDVKSKASRNYGISTKYLRTEFTLELEDPPVMSQILTCCWEGDAVGVPSADARNSDVRHSVSSAKTSVKDDDIGVLQTEVFAARNPLTDEIFLHAWLTNDVYTHLNSRDGIALLNHWMAGIYLTNEMLEAGLPPPSMTRRTQSNESIMNVTGTCSRDDEINSL